VEVLSERTGKRRCNPNRLGQMKGDIVIIQDADTEYDPSDYGALLRPILDGKADVVFGSRFVRPPRRVLFFWHSFGNRFLALLANMLDSLNLSDMETGFKVFTRQVLDSISIGRTTSALNGITTGIMKKFRIMSPDFLLQPRL
jgi:cellulose synthase/poly-beta-1,6-N-acetylglucosamine synthase-like glycosyltransferase